MKRFFAIFIFITISLPSFSETTLQGQISINEKTARNTAFENITENFPNKLLLANIIDPNYEENQNALRSGKINLKNRELCKFSSGIYGVRYKNDPYRAYYYTKDGRLDYTDEKSRLSYPHNVTTYNLKGNPIGSAYYVSKYEQYIFDKDKNLTTHWIGNIGYDKNGNVKASRKYY